MQEAFERAAQQSDSPLSREILETRQSQRRFEQALEIGANFNLLLLRPGQATIQKITRNVIDEKWQALKAELQKLEPTDQKDLLKAIGSGMGITDVNLDPLYKQNYPPEGAPRNIDYLVFAFRRLFNYDHHRGDAFNFFMNRWVLHKNKDVDTACAGIAEWLTMHP